MRQMFRGFAVGSGLLAGIASQALAQPFTLDEKINPTELKLEPYRAGGGKADGRLYGAVVTQTQEAQLKVQQGTLVSSDPAAVATGLKASQTQYQALLSVITALQQDNLFSHLQ